MSSRSALVAGFATIHWNALKGTGLASRTTAGWGIELTALDETLTAALAQVQVSTVEDLTEDGLSLAYLMHNVCNFPEDEVETPLGIVDPITGFSQLVKGRLTTTAKGKVQQLLADHVDNSWLVTHKVGRFVTEDGEAGERPTRTKRLVQVWGTSINPELTTVLDVRPKSKAAADRRQSHLAQMETQLWRQPDLAEELMIAVNRERLAINTEFSSLSKKVAALVSPEIYKAIEGRVESAGQEWHKSETMKALTR